MTISQRQDKVIDYLKHMTTLCTGSLLLITTFFDKLAGGSRQWTGLVALGIVAFVLSLGCLLYCLTRLTLHYGTPAEGAASYRLGVAMGISWLSFLGGIVCLAVFAAVNIF